MSKVSGLIPDRRESYCKPKDKDEESDSIDMDSDEYTVMYALSVSSLQFGPDQKPSTRDAVEFQILKCFFLRPGLVPFDCADGIRLLGKLSAGDWALISPLMAALNLFLNLATDQTALPVVSKSINLQSTLPQHGRISSQGKYKFCTSVKVEMLPRRNIFLPIILIGAKMLRFCNLQTIRSQRF